jgi:putative glycosyltransferase (TIGR04372 family)
MAFTKFQSFKKFLSKSYFFIIYLTLLAMPAGWRLSLWNRFSKSLEKEGDFLRKILPTERNGWMLLPAIFRASLISSFRPLRKVKGTFLISDRISIGESVIYFHFSYLRAKKLGESMIVPELGVEPNFELANFFFQKEERITVHDPIHQRLLEEIREKGSANDEVGVNLYANGLMGSYFKNRRWSDFSRKYDRKSDPGLTLLRESNPGLEESYLDLLGGENFIEQINHYVRAIDAQTDDPAYPGINREELENLKKKLGIHGPYVTLFLRPMASDMTAPRSIHHPENYHRAIDFLMEQGIQTVLLGTATGTRFPAVASLNGVVDYPRSGLQSLTHDLLLIQGCQFMITCNSGPSGIPLLFKTPTLWVNTVNPAYAIMVHNHRFYPKNILKKDGSRLRWDEWLKSPALYAQHERHYREAGLQWEDLSAEQILDAVVEFKKLVDDPRDTWKTRTPRQHFFFSKTKPYHLNLYEMSGAPCESFLEYIDCPESLS